MEELLRALVDDSLPFIASLIAVCVSFISFARSYKHKTHTTVQNTIEATYREFKEFNNLRFDNPFHSHLFELPSHYKRIKNIISEHASKLEPSMRIQYIMKERAIAILIFSNYESILYSNEIAKQQKNNNLIEFLTEVISYMETQWLRNPRLLYMWDSSEHALKELFEHETQARFTKNVLNFCGNIKRDANGPTGYKIDNDKKC